MAKKESVEMRGTELNTKELRALIAETIRTCSENFLQLHGGRGVGKTYTTQKTVIEECLANGTEFLLTVPTKTLMESGALRKWVAKVIRKEYPKWQHKSTHQYFYVRRDEEEDWQRVGQCLALSGAEEAKIDSDVSTVSYMIWDESMRVDLDAKLADTLIELFLFAYHTVDRDENRVKAVFLGNALNKTDPLYSFFGVDIKALKRPGIVVRSLNRMSWYVPTPDDLVDEEENLFRQMIKGTKYGEAAAGNFDLSYGYLIGDPGEYPVTSCVAIEFSVDGYLLLMISERVLYIEACKREFAERYAGNIYSTTYK